LGWEIAEWGKAYQELNGGPEKTMKEREKLLRRMGLKICGRSNEIVFKKIKKGHLKWEVTLITK